MRSVQLHQRTEHHDGIRSYAVRAPCANGDNHNPYRPFRGFHSIYPYCVLCLPCLTGSLPRSCNSDPCHRDVHFFGSREDFSVFSPRLASNCGRFLSANHSLHHKNRPCISIYLSEIGGTVQFFSLGMYLLCGGTAVGKPSSGGGGGEGIYCDVFECALHSLWPTRLALALTLTLNPNQTSSAQTGFFLSLMPWQAFPVGFFLPNRPS